MVAPRIAFLLGFLVFAATLWPAKVQRVRAAAEPVLILAGLNFPNSDISLVDLKNAFRGRQVFVGGRRVVPLNHPLGSSLRILIDQRLLGLSPAEVGRYWVDRRIRDDGTPPKSPPTAELAIRVVSVLPNAITYGNAAMKTATVKVLTVDGAAAGQPGYPL